jgi:hypothetical protein
MSNPYLSPFDQDEFPVDPNLSYEQIEQHISQVTSFWAAGKLDELVNYVKKLIDIQIYDIRILSFYFYSLWEVEELNCSLDQVLDAFQNLLKQPDDIWFLKEETEGKTEQTTAQDETTRKQLTACLNLFFNRVVQKLERFADQAEMEDPQPCEVIKKTEQFSEFLEQTFQFGDMQPLVQQISPYFSDACKKNIEEKAMEEEALEEEKNDEEELPLATDEINELEKTEYETLIIDEPQHTIEQTDIVAPSPAKQQPAEQKSTTPYALPMQQLLNKLQIFEILMSNADIYKAAIVFENIQNELQQFNPLHYLPELFSNYAKTHALYATDLYQLIHQHDNAQSQALKDYFAIDPEGFLQLEIDDNVPEQQMRDDPYAFHEE